MSNKQKSTKVAILGLFTAIIIVLQLMSYAIKIGNFNLSLVLIPIVLAAVLYGPKQSAFLGAVFGVVVTVASMAGLDGGGFILFSANPLLTTLICLIKGALAGLFAGLIAQPLKKKNNYLAVLVAAIVTPVTNTGLFVAGMFFCFRDILNEWAGGSDVVTYALVSLVGVNFIIELALNLVLSPAVLRVSTVLQKTAKKD